VKKKFGPSSKGGVTKNINTKAESLTVSWKSDFDWSGRVRITYCQLQSDFDWSEMVRITYCQLENRLWLVWKG